VSTVNGCRVSVVSTTPEHSTSRDERRRRTEAAILDAARALFAEAGFERATIRAVAAAAGVDPALVMQYFGSKEGLFAAAATWSSEHETVLSAPKDQVPAAALRDMIEKFEGQGDREAAVALMRNCLTHPEAARIMRDEVMCDRAAGVARTIGGDDAELRAGLLGACMIGLGMARYLLEIPAVAGASREDVVRLMEPVLQALVDPPTQP
jgi:AcrR family transcriptional regulator